MVILPGGCFRCRLFLTLVYPRARAPMRPTGQLTKYLKENQLTNCQIKLDSPIWTNSALECRASFLPFLSSAMLQSHMR